MAAYSNEPERPRSEPDIIPPDQHRERQWQPSDYTQTGTHRVYVTRIGPFGFTMLMLAVGFLAAVMLLLLISTALIWLPFIAVLVVVAAVAGFLRRL
jgi:hypothetical protein